jgi:mono/diheme cytochrome c family protein
MSTKNKHTVERHGERHWVLTGILFILLLSALVPSCTHDPFTPDPNPIDTTGNPIDTTGNPIDTTADTTVVSCDSNIVYFEQQILPILRSNCAKSGCHDAISHEEDLVLDSYNHLMNGEENIVRPFNVSGSKLYKVITESDQDDVMPPPPNQKLTSDQIELMAKWIQQGAKDLSCEEVVITCDTTAVSYSGFVAPLLTTYCVGCHSGGAPSGNILLNSHAAVKTVAQNGKLIGSITWAAGYQPMPRGSAKLSSCNIAKIKAWVNNGAPNN